MGVAQWDLLGAAQWELLGATQRELLGAAQWDLLVARALVQPRHSPLHHPFLKTDPDHPITGQKGANLDRWIFF